MKRANETNIHPGIILKKDVIDANQLTTGHTANYLGISRLTLSKITNGKGSKITNGKGSITLILP